MSTQKPKRPAIVQTEILLSLSDVRREEREPITTGTTTHATPGEEERK